MSPVLFPFQDFLPKDSVSPLLIAQAIKNLPAMQETQVWFLSREDPLEKEMATHCSILAEESYGQRKLVCYGPRGPKSWTRLSDLHSLFFITHTFRCLLIQTFYDTNLTQYKPNSAVATGLEKVSFHSNPKERQFQRMLRLPPNCTC